MAAADLIFGEMKKYSTVVIVGIRLLQIRTENAYQLEISDNAGISWQQKFSGSGVVGRFDGLAVKGKIVFAETSEGKFRSHDEGLSWIRISA